MSDNNEERPLGFNTRSLHAGQRPDEATGARAVPIYQTTSFVFENSEHAASLFALQQFGNIYTRIMNPTTGVFEERVASLEGGLGALAVSSGQSAQFLTISGLCEVGDELVSAATLYGGTYTQMDTTFRRLGFNTTFVEPDDPENFRKAITPKTKLLYIETIANPRMNVVDIAAVAAIAHENGIPLVINHPGLDSSPYKDIAKKYMPKGAGAIFTFGIEGGIEAGKKLIDNVQLFSHLANVGDAKSLVIHPGSTTHQQLSDEDMEACGVTPDMVRLSVGLEDVEDLIWDLDQAIEASQKSD